MRDDTHLLPLHLQVRNTLRTEILEGLYAGRIPPEHELMQRFQVSRATVRRAIRTLTEEGVLESKQGLGTFVAVRPIEEWLGNLSTFFEIVDEMGMKPSIRVLSQGMVNTPPDILNIFNAPKVYATKRLRLANEIPVVLEKQFYPPAIGRKLAEYDLNNVSTYDILETKLGINLWEAKQAITAVIPDSAEKDLLGITEEPCCVILSTRLVTDPEGQAVEYEKSIFRGDMYTFKINLSRRRRI